MEVISFFFVSDGKMWGANNKPLEEGQPPVHKWHELSIQDYLDAHDGIPDYVFYKNPNNEGE